MALDNACKKYLNTNNDRINDGKLNGTNNCSKMMINKPTKKIKINRNY